MPQYTYTGNRNPSDWRIHKIIIGYDADHKPVYLNRGASANIDEAIARQLNKRFKLEPGTGVASDPVVTEDPVLAETAQAVKEQITGDPELSASGRELAFAENKTLIQNQNHTGYTDLPGVNISFTPGVRPVYVELFVPWLIVGTLDAIFMAAICKQSDNSVVVAGDFSATKAFARGQVRALKRFTQADGPQNLKVRTKISAGVFGLNDPTNGVVGVTLRAWEA